MHPINQINSTQSSFQEMPPLTCKTIKRKISELSHVTLEYKDGAVYKGFIDKISKLPHGEGSLTTKSGDLFTGRFKNGLFKIGTIAFSNGILWKGKIKNLQFKTGKLFDLNNMIVREGSFKNGALHGQGEMQINAFKYSGKFKNGMLILGKIKCPSGDILEGKFGADGKLEYGSWTRVDSVSQGFFKNELMEGVGKRTFKDGTVEDGYFKEGKLHGVGRKIKGGETFVGQWKMGEAINVMTKNKINHEEKKANSQDHLSMYS